MQDNTGPDNTTITLTVAGAAPEQIEAGVIAACKLFEQAGVHPYAAAACAFRRDHPAAGDALSDDERAWADLWDDATCVALDVACEGLPMEPSDWRFHLDWPGKTATTDPA